MTMLAPPSPQTEMFDLAHDALVRGDIYAAMGTLRRTLREQRAQLPQEEWVTFGDQARRHPLHRLLLESPFTRRAYEKPRGYAGDAVLMDLIYGLAQPRGDLSPLGGMLYGYEFDSPCFKSVRTRRATLAGEIDSVAETRPHTEVLAVASGHLREIEWSRAARAGAVTLTALDQDRDSLECVGRAYQHYRLATVPASIGDLLRRSVNLPEFDLVYAAGLYDYLEEDLARTLTATLFRHVSPGGRLLIANFTTKTYDAAFMEAFMDWRLVYRTPEEVRRLAAAIPRDEVGAIDQFCDDNEHVTYMRIVKR
jgi:extracellular factor (EF) 3-hydroxypalmitic acid methyl ester biosynthesis protein